MALLFPASGAPNLNVSTEDAARFQVPFYTGGGRHNQVGVTTATFVIAAVNGTQSVAFDARDTIRMQVNSQVQIADGTRTINGTVLSVNGGTLLAVVQTNTIVAGSAGNTMSTAATITPITTGTFVVAAVAANQTVPMGSVAACNLFPIGDTVTITASADTVVGTVAGINGSGLVVTTTTISSGSAGDTAATAATVTSTSGDRICFAIVMPYVEIGDLSLIMDATAASMQVKAGYFATDGTETSHLADLIVTATAFATATRLRANAGVKPPTTDSLLNSYLAVTIQNADLPAANNIYAVPVTRYKGNP